MASETAVEPALASSASAGAINPSTDTAESVATASTASSGPETSAATATAATAAATTTATAATVDGLVSIEGTANNRVKVYEMSAAMQWIDKGTGHVACPFIEAKGCYGLVVRSETDGTAIVSTRLHPKVSYTKQQETLIVWAEPEGSDLALSFQEAAGCVQMWNHIQELQQRMAADKHDIDQLPLSEAAEVAPEDALNMSTELPDPSFQTLPQIEQIIQMASRTIFTREITAKHILESQFLPKLLSLFAMCEDLESTQELFMLSSIMRTLLLFNERSIYEYILQEDIFLQIVGVLEYDKEFPHIKANHREYLQTQTRFKEVIPIKAEYVINKIKETYRAQYLKDVVLVRVADDQTFQTISSIIYLNHVEIIYAIRNDPEYLDKTFELLSKDDIPSDKKKDVILFLNELTVISGGFQKMTRSDFYRVLSQHGLFALFDITLGDIDEAIRVAAISILHTILEHEPSLVRSFCHAQAKENQKTLIGLMIDRFHNEQDLGLRSQLAECLRILVDTSGIDSAEDIVPHVDHKSDAESFLMLFYERGHCEQLFEPMVQLQFVPLVDAPDGYQVLKLDQRMVSVYSHLCDLLCFIIEQHAMYSKNYLLRNTALKNATLLLKAKEAHLRLSALRVYRKCIGSNEDFYRRLLIKLDVFGPIFTALLQTKGKYNLLNSACLEFFDFISKASGATGTKQLIAHIVQSYSKFFDALDYVEIFKKLSRMFEMSLESDDSAPTAAQLRQETRSLPQSDGWAKQDSNEDAYFNTSDDEDSDASTPIVSHAEASPAAVPDTATKTVPKRVTSPAIEKRRLTRLVDYPDDDDDEDEDDLSNIGVKRRSLLIKPIAQRITFQLASNSKVVSPKRPGPGESASSFGSLSKSAATIDMSDGNGNTATSSANGEDDKGSSSSDTQNSSVTQDTDAVKNIEGDASAAWQDKRLEKMFKHHPLDKTKLKELAAQGIPSSMRSSIYQKLLKTDMLSEFETDYKRAQTRTHGLVIPADPIPPMFGGRLQHTQLALNPTGRSTVNHILCILAHDNPTLEFCPFLPPVVALLAHHIDSPDALLACVSSLLRLNTFQHPSQTSIANSNAASGSKSLMPGESNAARRWIYFPVHRKESKLFSRAFGNLMYRTDRKMHAYLTDLHSTSPDPFWTPWLQNMFINVLPQPILWRFLDVFLVEGYKALLRFGMATLMLRRDAIMSVQSIAELTRLVTPPLFDDATLGLGTRSKRYKSVADEMCATAEGVSVNYADVKRVHEHHASLAAVSQESGDLLDSGAGNLKYQRALPKFVGAAVAAMMQQSDADEYDRSRDDDDGAFDGQRFKVDPSPVSGDPETTESENRAVASTTTSGNARHEDLSPSKQQQKQEILLPTSTIASTDAWVALWSWIPPHKRIDSIELCFTTKVHGYNLGTLYQTVKDSKPLILAFETVQGDVFGAYLSEGIPDLKTNSELAGKWIGNGECFLFSLLPHAKMFPWVGRTNELMDGPSFFLNLTPTSLSIGGGGEHLGIQIDESLRFGTTGKCTTFMNDSLTSDRSQRFECVVVEAFAFASE
eukprot:jgi/Hompol1/864/HPOL_002583-RA